MELAAQARANTTPELLARQRRALKPTTGAPAAVATTNAVVVTEASLRTFYAQHNPANTAPDRLKIVLQHYDGRHDKLIKDLSKRYGAAASAARLAALRTRPAISRRGCWRRSSNHLSMSLAFSRTWRSRAVRVFSTSFAWTRTAASASKSSIFIQIASCVDFQHHIGIYWLRATSCPSMRTSARVDGVWGSFATSSPVLASVLLPLAARLGFAGCAGLSPLSAERR